MLSIIINSNSSSNSNKWIIVVDRRIKVMRRYKIEVDSLISNKAFKNNNNSSNTCNSKLIWVEMMKMMIMSMMMKTKMSKKLTCLSN